MDYLKALKDFQKAVWVKTGDNRHKVGQQFIPGNSSAMLRVRLNAEEIDELNIEMVSGEPDKAAMLKELCDSLYVLFAVAAIYNLPLDDAFKMVHENNMLKVNTGTIAEGGKLTKAEDHPSVDLNVLLEDKDTKLSRLFCESFGNGS